MQQRNKDRNYPLSKLQFGLSSCRESHQFLKRVRTVCFGSDYGRLLFGPYKYVAAVKLMNNYSNNKLQNLHGFKEEVKIKGDAVNVVARRFPNRTATIMKLLEAAAPPIDLD